MIFAINPINNNDALSSVTKATNALLEKYNKSQSDSRVASVVVFQSLSYLSGSSQAGLTMESLTNLKQTMENQNLKSTSAFQTVDNLIENFDMFSSDGRTITESDFMNVISFADAKNVLNNASYEDLNSVLKQIGSDISSSVASQFGMDTALTIAFMNFMNNLSDENLNSLIASSKSNTSSSNTENSNAQSSADTTYAPKAKTSPYATNPIQDYRTVTKAQLKSPINIAV